MAIAAAEVTGNQILIRFLITPPTSLWMEPPERSGTRPASRALPPNRGNSPSLHLGIDPSIAARCGMPHPAGQEWASMRSRPKRIALVALVLAEVGLAVLTWRDLRRRLMRSAAVSGSGGSSAPSTPATRSLTGWSGASTGGPARPDRLGPLAGGQGTGPDPRPRHGKRTGLVRKVTTIAGCFPHRLGRARRFCERCATSAGNCRLKDRADPKSPRTRGTPRLHAAGHPKIVAIPAPNVCW